MTHDIDEAIKMGDLVVVMQIGGYIAQAGTPAEIPASPGRPTSVARFGADRGLKRLSLYRVADIPPDPAVTVTVARLPLGRCSGCQCRTPARCRARR
ncbi:MAG: hypothetical protein U0869_07050 [Chloroflexota bacterium]